MIKEIYEYLSSDDELKTLLFMTDNTYKIHFINQDNSNDYPFITYQISPFLAGQTTDQYRLEVRIITKDEIQLESITKRVIDLLHFRAKPGFKVNETIIYNSFHTGGGLIYDSENKVFEQVLIFNLISK